MSESISQFGAGDGGKGRRVQSDANLPAVADARLPARFEPGASRPDIGRVGTGPGLAAYASLLLRHRWIIVVSVVSALALGLALTLVTQPTYTARAVLRIDREAEKIVGSEAATSADNLGDEFFQTQYGMLRSRALSIRVSQSLGLDADDHFIRAMAGTKSNANGTLNLDASARRDEVIDLLQGYETVVPERGSRLVTVGFTSPDPAVSARIANAYAETFIASALDQRYQASAYAREFLERRLGQVRTKLEQSERDLVAYATAKQIIPLANGQNTSPDNTRSLPGTDLEAYSAAMASARTDRIRAEQRWRQTQATTGFGVPEILQSPTIQELSKEHAKLAAEYQDKLKIFKADYPDMTQLSARIAETERQLNLEAANIRGALHEQYLAALQNEKALGGQVQGLKTAVLDLRGRSIQYTILQREVDTNRTLYDGLLQRYKEVGVAGGVAASNISIVDRAEAPKFPSHPRPMMNMVLSGLAGMLLGVGLAFCIDIFDQAIRTPADIEGKLGLVMLGTIPTLKNRASAYSALKDSRSPLSEAYYSLRSALQFSTAEGFPGSLLVTSAWPGGGKSTTAFALGQNVARLGYRALIIDCDMRKPTMHKLTGIENRDGLSHVLTGAISLTDAAKPTEQVNLFVVPAGPTPPNPAELLAGPRFKAMVAEANSRFDVVIFDGPPVMGLADAPTIGAVADGCLLVIECRRSRRPQVHQALNRLNMNGSHLLGALLTRYSPPRTGYGYAYDYDYGTATNAKAKRGFSLAKIASQAGRIVSKS